ncbi:MAG: PadR family transcriptional regulator [Patescibacteria group bacterium]|nr:PadR family transcriptional regulator [Patescibacteria group bacterium]
MRKKCNNIKVDKLWITWGICPDNILTKKSDVSRMGPRYIQFFVLKILSRMSQSPKEINGRLNGIGFKTPTGSLYPLMRKLKRSGLAITGYEESDTGVRIKTYSLTEKGHNRLTDFRGDWRRLNDVVNSL